MCSAGMLSSFKVDQIMNGFISKLKKLETDYTAYVEILFRSMQPEDHN